MAAYVMISALLVGAGWTLVQPLADSGLVSWDRRSVERLAEGRTEQLDSVSLLWSRLADAPSIVGVAVVFGAVLAVRRHWRDIVLIAAVLALELLMFLTISYTVGRERPSVDRLGSVPSTGSFPSGHVAATIVLYGFATALLARHRAPQPLVALSALWTVVAALSVGWARVYRGMHHPLDVVAGSLMGISLLVAFLWTTKPLTKQRAVNESREVMA